MGKQWLTLFFLVSKIIADVDCSHEMKRCLLLRSKVMTNLDSILKSKDITFPRKIHLVKGMVFPVVMYGCESWTVKESWAPQNWCFWTVVLEKTFDSPLDCKEIQPVHPKGNQSWIFTGRTDVEAETPINDHLMRRADSFEKTLMLGKIQGRRRRGWQRMRWLDGTTNSMGHEFDQTPGDSEGQGSLVCCSPCGHEELDTTEPLNNNEQQAELRTEWWEAPNPGKI